MRNLKNLISNPQIFNDVKQLKAEVSAMFGKGAEGEIDIEFDIENNDLKFYDKFSLLFSFNTKKKTFVFPISISDKNIEDIIQLFNTIQNTKC
jgi:hypothetical protein